MGCSITPSDVRLVTSENDPYRWSYVTGVAHFFTKNLSDHSISVYKQLCSGVGITFEAVSAGPFVLSEV